MITNSKQAREFIETKRSEAPDHKWYLMVYWQKGEMENRRGADGEALWERLPDPGWSVEPVGYRPEDVPNDLGEVLAAGVRVVIEPREPQPFPGGAVEFEQGRLKVSVNAV